MYSIGEKTVDGHAASQRVWKEEVDEALMGLFNQVSGALSCWAACEGSSLLSEAA